MNGTGHIATATLEADFTLTDVTWLAGNCLPTSGDINCQLEGKDTMVTFLDKTPTTGIVLVTIGAFHPFEQELLHACQ